ncbi:MAG: NADP-reducing hydrogenase subunit HndA [Firmicutes bacterium]|nr:NADP-reducing hydrogenase subunit HndA [Bacillota bacterium]
MGNSLKIDEILLSYKGKKDELIPILQQVQKGFGYLPEQVMVKIARFTGLPESRIYAVATSYAQFRFSPAGRNRVMVCRGTACHVRGATRILEEVSRQLGIREGETTPDLEHSLETVACIGCCALAPCIIINNKDIHGRLTPKGVAQVFTARKKGGQDAS